ncbi:MAG: hypothetical protein Q9207_002191 [Kuettlingeria erythrocarpa]
MVTTGALFGIALIAYAARTYIRTFVVKQFLVEDGLLLFAVVCLCGTTGLAFRNMPSLYNILAVILHGPDLQRLVETLHEIPEISKRNNAAATLWWAVIYPVKLAFLFFFRRLIQQESSIAVTVVSISAFRSLFVAASMNRPTRKPFRQSVNEWRRKVERRRIGPTTNEQEIPVADTLPRVPSPTLTGMSSLLRRL